MPRLKRKIPTTIHCSWYLPCRNCGKWRREHLRTESDLKCPFAAGVFKAKRPKELTASERRAVLTRTEALGRQIVGAYVKEVDRLQAELDRLIDAATEGCSHADEDGVTFLLEEELPAYTPGKRRRHTICELCHEDWYDEI